MDPARARGYGTVNTPTTLTPVPPPTPETIAVYAPGSSVIRMADSAGSVGATPVAEIADALGALCQSSLVAMTVESDWRTSCSCGFGSGLVMPKGTSDGPVAVINTCCGPVPCTIRPAII